MKIYEAEGKTAVIAFGRMNPPTIGHAKLADKIASLPGDPYIFLSHSQKPKTDPLSFEQKAGYAKAFFPNVTVGDPEVRTAIQAFSKISDMGYSNLIYVAGSDRVDDFQKLLSTYNGQPDKEGNVAYNFDNIKVVSAGARDPDAEGAEGMSASKMRAAAASGDFESFKSGTPDPKLAQAMYRDVRNGLGMMESLARIIEVATMLKSLDEVKPITEDVKKAFGVVVEAWSEKYKRSINCNNPKGFSQRAHCAGRKKNEDVKEDATSSDLSSVYTPSIPEIAKKHNISLQQVVDQLKKGLAKESEHTKNFDVALEIAMDHVAEIPDYYDRIEDIEGPYVEKAFNEDVAQDLYPKQTESISEAGVGRITKQNATKDAPIGSEYANVKKLGLGSGKPKELHAKARKNSDPNTLFNLGLTEGQLNEKGSIGIPLSSGMTVVIAPHRPLKVKKSKKKVKMVGAGGEE